MTLRGVHRLQHVLVLQLQPAGDVGHRRLPAQAGGELGRRLLDLQDPLLDSARDPDRPAAIAEMALQLAEDGRYGEGRERGSPAGVEAVDRFTRPMLATWIRSSSGSAPREYLRASRRASGMKRSISSSRAASDRSRAKRRSSASSPARCSSTPGAGAPTSGVLAWAVAISPHLRDTRYVRVDRARKPGFGFPGGWGPSSPWFTHQGRFTRNPLGHTCSSDLCHLDGGSTGRSGAGAGVQAGRRSARGHGDPGMTPVASAG